MQDLREVIANNISELRVARGLTQAELAALMNYSDKAVSKWERAESLPDVTVIKQLADLFCVSVDYMLSEKHDGPPPAVFAGKQTKRKRFIVSSLAAMLVWLIATCVFIQLNISFPNSSLPAWMAFVYAFPVSATVVLIFNSIWGRTRMNYLIISVMVWSFILALYLSFLTLGVGNFWMIFVLGVPAEIIIILWSGLGSGKA